MHRQHTLPLKSFLESELRTHGQKRFVGLDVSLRSSGIALLQGDGTLVQTQNVRTLESGVMIAGHAMSKALQDCMQHTSGQVVECGVEDFALGYAPNSSSSQTRFTLARINGIASYEAWRLTGAPVLFYSPSRIRAYFGLKSRPSPDASTSGVGQAQAGKSGAVSKAKYVKQAVLSYVQAVHPTFRDCLPERLLHAGAGGKGKRARNGLLSSAAEEAGLYDRADAVLTGMYTLAKYYEWRAVSTDTIWWPYVHAALPSLRLGRTTVAGLQLGADKLAAVMDALQKLHEHELRQVRHARVVWPKEGQWGDVGEEGSGPLTDNASTEQRKRGGSKRRRTDLTSVGDAPALDNTSKLYDKLRDTFAEDCRRLLLGSEMGHDTAGAHETAALLQGWRVHS